MRPGLQFKYLSKMLLQPNTIEGSLLEKASYVKKESSGFYSLLPFGQLTIKKLVAIIENELEALGSFKLSLPSLQPSQIWRQSGRYESIKKEVFTTESDEYLLAPTFEEQMCITAKDMIRSHRQLPLRLYQTGTKWRNELRPRAGLARLKEFIMKDLYTFDANIEDAHRTFNLIKMAYERIFRILELPVVAAQASTGMMGGLASTEFHKINPILGEDTLLICDSCQYTANKEVVSNSDECPECHGRLSFREYPGLELGHLFVLGTRYSEPLQVHFTNSQQKRECVQMGCYGLGISRMLEALAEHHADIDGLRWPINLAPFPLNIITKYGNDAELFKRIAEHYQTDQCMIDDREELSIGKRIKDSFMHGIPTTVVVGNAWRERGMLEEFQRHESKCNMITL